MSMSFLFPYNRVSTLAEGEEEEAAGPVEAHKTIEGRNGGSKITKPKEEGEKQDEIVDFGHEDHRAIFWSRRQGIYFAYKWRCIFA